MVQQNKGNLHVAVSKRTNKRTLGKWLASLVATSLLLASGILSLPAFAGKNDIPLDPPGTVSANTSPTQSDTGFASKEGSPSSYFELETLSTATFSVTAPVQEGVADYEWKDDGGSGCSTNAAGRGLTKAITVTGTVGSFCVFKVRAKGLTGYADSDYRSFHVKIIAAPTPPGPAVTYDPGAGNVTPGSQLVSDAPLTTPTPTLANNVFLGWYSAESAGVKVVNAGASYSPSAAVTLYARWMPTSDVTVALQINPSILNYFKSNHYYTSTAQTTLQATSNYSGVGGSYKFVKTGHPGECEDFPNGGVSSNGSILYTISEPLLTGQGCDFDIELYIDDIKIETSLKYHVYFGPNPYALTPEVTANSRTGYVGTPIDQIDPVPTGFACQEEGYTAAFTYSVEPALPSGLSINSTTGVISGTPLETTDETYVLTAACGEQDATTEFTLDIRIEPGLSASGGNGTVGQFFTTSAPTPSDFTCSPIVYSVSGVLPASLELNTSTGVISGIPANVLSSTNYTLTATCGEETASDVISIRIQAAVSPEVSPSLVEQTVVFSGDNFVFGDGSWRIVSPATATADPDLGAPRITYAIVAHPGTTAENCAITSDGVLTYSTGGSCYVVARAAAIGIYGAAVSEPVQMRAWVEGDLTENVLNPMGYTLLTGSGFTPNSLVRLELHSTPIFLGYARADADGFVSIRVRMPREAQMGSHEVWMMDMMGSEIYMTNVEMYIVKLPVKIVAQLAMTGSASVILASIIGSLMLLVSSVLMVAGRRRRRV
mgnify:CR=1 FL=1